MLRKIDGNRALAANANPADPLQTRGRAGAGGGGGAGRHEMRAAGEHRAQVRDAEWIVGIPLDGSAACYAVRKPMFRRLCGSL